MTNHSVINLNNWKRKEHYQFFSDFDDPTFSLTTDIDVTQLWSYCQNNQQSLFLYYLHATMQAINETPEMCMRCVDNKVVLFKHIHGNTTFLNDDDLFGFCEIFYAQEPSVFCHAASQQLKLCKAKSRDLLVVPNRDDVVYFSCLPWLNFTQFKHPFSTHGNASIPKIMFGKIVCRNGQYRLPIGITVHHGLVDGVHLGRFFEKLQKAVNRQ